MDEKQLRLCAESYSKRSMFVWSKCFRVDRLLQLNSLASIKFDSDSIVSTPPPQKKIQTNKKKTQKTIATESRNNDRLTGF